MTREPSQDRVPRPPERDAGPRRGVRQPHALVRQARRVLQAFVAFDFYFQAGVSFAQLKTGLPDATSAPTCCPASRARTRSGRRDLPPDNNPNNDAPLNTGSRVGLYLGGGIHVFLNDFLALDLTVRDYAFSDNPSGADYNADLFVGKNTKTGEDDNRFLHHLFFGAGVAIMFPTTVKRLRPDIQRHRLS